MRTSTAGRSSERRLPPATARGFTLLELSVMLLVLAIAASFVVPRLRDTEHAALAASAERFASMTRYLYAEAALRRRPMRLNLELDEQTYWVTVFDEDPEVHDFVVDEGLLSRPVTLPRGVGFRDVVLPSVGTVREGAVFVQFTPEGWVDPMVVHFATRAGEVATVAVEPLSGRARVAYEDVDIDVLEPDGGRRDALGRSSLPTESELGRRAGSGGPQLRGRMQRR